MIGRWIVIGGVCAGLASCAGVPELSQKMEIRASCCKSPAEFKYEQLSAGATTAFSLGEESPVYVFDTGKSYFSAFALPPQSGQRKLRVISHRTGSVALETRKWAQVYCPQITFLDSDHRPIASTGRIPVFARGFWSSSFISDFDIPEGARYLVAHTNQSKFGQIAYWYTSGGAYMVGSAVVVDRGGEAVPYPCAPIANAELQLL